MYYHMVMTNQFEGICNPRLLVLRITNPHFYDHGL